MNIYLASSWKNAPYLNTLAQHLREAGHKVDCFCDPSLKRSVFKWDDLDIPPRTMDGMNAIHMLAQPKVRKAFKEDKKWLDWADVVVMVLPCGNSAHLEAGYAKGAGKKLIIYGTFPPGGRDVMYGFADALIPESFMDLCAALEKLKEK